ncbi:AraC family transcriptional regulator [Paenibacillus turpanensis]|uniref:AraC family transcriptional regulator n=1 Tax=Paenibacillus turpanensis TaxID=2689078 RepID=UPI00140E4162|nr:GyrI-like domain-containing protein [Paenibacillus turpanensis]
MNLKLEALPNYRIAYVRQVGPYGPHNKQAMETLKQWAAKNHLLTESAILFGIAQDNPETTPPEHCRYDACIVISKDAPADEAISEAELPGGQYVMCTIKHTAEDIQQAWMELFPAIQKSGYQMDNRPILERYTVNLLNDELCELCVPVTPLSLESK